MTDFITEPDGVEVVATSDGTYQPLLVLDVVADYLDAHGIGSGPLSWKRIGEGQSNITYLMRRGDAAAAPNSGQREFVLRRGPRPPIPKSTHDMLREARIQRAVRGAGVAVPTILAVCEDESLLGVPFYVMDFVEGEIITSSLPAVFDGVEARGRISELLVDSLVALHSIDVAAEPFNTLGRAEGYLERQVNRFATLWPEDSPRRFVQLDELASWLKAHIPTSQRASLVHGDYRLGNVMFGASAGSPQLAAVLDWEMATLGDPLADLGYLTATWSVAGEPIGVMTHSPVTALSGFLDREGLVARYVAATGLDASALPWYQTLALWKSTVFLEDMYARWLKGERPGDDYAPRLEDGIPQLFDLAESYAAQL
jgi:aminoglycoside phosphotransferase (APT) family kinase protein